MIEVKDLSFSYGKNAVLENISLNLENGRVYGLLGENGVGKTTLLTLLCGLKKPDAGTIRVDGHEPYRRLSSSLCSQYFLPDDVMAYNLPAESFAKFSGKFWPKFDMDKFNRIMEEFETETDQKMNRMSAGQLKKTYIAFALACNPDYLFMDEPTNGLDIPSKAQFRKAVTLYTEEDSTVVISTHQVRDLENIIDPIIILDKRDVLINASTEKISEKLYFDYGNVLRPDALYSEQLPGGFIQVTMNPEGLESKVNIEALFNAVHNHKELIKSLFE